MRRIELTMTADYIDWTVEEAVRDLVQNGIDADKKGFPFSYDLKDDGKLTLLNEGATMPTSVLLIGFSTKRGDSDAIGQFGEGLKLSVLTMLRHGHGVEILVGRDVWTPKIARSENFPDQDVLVFDIEEAAFGDGTQIGVKVVVNGIEKWFWDRCRQKFLKFRDSPANVPFGEAGLEVLSDDSLRGHIFVGGIEVGTIDSPHLAYGYNFPPKSVAVDRDRRMVNVGAVLSATAAAWGRWAEKADEAFDALWTMLESDASDVQQCRYSWNLPETVSSKVADRFRWKYGERAFPIVAREADDARVLTNTSAKTVLIEVPTVYCEVLRRTYPSLATKLWLASCNSFEAVPWHCLIPVRAHNFLTCWKLACAAVDDKDYVAKVVTEVVRFDDITLAGTHSNSEPPTIRIAEAVLDSPAATLATFLHELAHRKGLHQDVAFLNALEASWEKATEILWAVLMKENATHG